VPRFPKIAERTNHITGSVFEKFRSKVEAHGSDLVNLHIGDAYAPPPYAIPIDPRFMKMYPRFNRYTDTFGVYELREALATKLQTENQLDARPTNIMMTAGACNALNVSVQTLVDPGEDVLLLSPYWPFFRGMVGLAGGRVIEVPFYTRLYEEPDLDIAAYLEGYLTAKTVALYANTPNNPSGKVLNKRQLRQIADFARQNRLWIISDEAYDGMTFDDHVHLSIGSLPEMFEQTLSIFTFSKVYMFSGLRLGYVVTTDALLKNLNKIMVHQLYSPATVAQQMMVEPVKTRSLWSTRFVEHFWEIRDMFVANLKISLQVPEGTYYLFFSIEEHLRGREYWQVIDECLQAGVTVAPGEDFGKDYAQWIRICFAGEPPDRVELAVQRLNRIFPP